MWPTRSERKEARAGLGVLARTGRALWIFVVLLCACKGGNRDGLPEMRKVETVKTMPLDAGGDAPSCSIVLDMVEVLGEGGNAERINRTVMQRAFGLEANSMAEAADSFCLQRFSFYKESLSGLYEADKKHRVNSAWYDYRYALTAACEAGRGNILCYEITATRYEGGAREVTECHELNFDLETGDVVTLDDWFQPVYKAVLPPLLMEELLEKFDCADRAALQEKGVLRFTDLYVPANYKLGKDGITFIYNPDEIAPYAAGIIRLGIPYGSLGSILKDNNE